MKTLRIVALCAIGMFVGQAWAQDKPVPSGTAPSAQDVGGVSDASRGETGMAMNPARQSYPDLNTLQSPEQSRIAANTFRHH
ncbi:hypothetical protein B0G80_8211 [Paraburkholderia sp. BL6669N2]|uniref:hypothetical protein n=1 Tax=Paraburkholderia sp. BL6669N2 TaxID=1938807 RepID=UPI000E22BB24|nr:hypothetical protein [Paraburkholderia sp. BL6669N2]REG51706.1 hypothetical protein B0G80_8211 [Paraburkholderia sp. BL6669N2]